MKGKKNGFTLLEMLIVIAIVAILYAMAAANIMGMQYEAKIAKAKGDLKTLELALNSYINNNHVCPDKQSYQTTLLLAKIRIMNGYMYDPFAASVNTPYLYNTSGNNWYYVAFSVGMWRNCSATIANDGMVETNNDPMLVTNGYLSLSTR